MALNSNNPWTADVARIQAAIKQNLANIARDEAALGQNPGNITAQRQLEYGRSYQTDLQQQLNIFLAEYNAVEAQPTVSSGSIVANANQARDENASATLPSTNPQVITPVGRIQPAGSGPNGVGQISGTNATETPTQQNTPTVGTNTETRPISQTQAANNQSGQLVPVPGSGQLVPVPGTVPSNTQASVRAIDNAIAATGGPGVGAGADAGGTNPTKAVSSFPQYRAQTQSYVYLATTITSVFKQGRFEQALHGTLYTQLTANTTQTNAQQRQETALAAFDGIPAGGQKVDIRKTTVGTLPMKQQAAIAAGTDPNTVNDQGMAFGGGGL